MQGNKKPPKIDGYIVKYQKLTNEITVTGSILAFDEVELKNEVAGRITQINLPEGEFVKKGTLLVKLYDDDLQATLRNLETQLKIKEMLYRKQKDLVKANGMSENEFIENGLQIEMLKSEIEVQKVKIRKTEVRAPFDGFVGLRNVSEGAEITTSTIVATLRTNQKLKIDFSVPEKYGSIIKHGMPINFLLNGNDSIFKAKVFATEQGIDPNTRSLKVRALVVSTGEAIIPGAFAKINLVLSDNPQAITIPPRSIIPGAKNKKVIVSKMGKAHFQEVKIGLRQLSTVEIVEGLSVGDTIITSGIMMLKEGAEIKYSSIENAN